MFGCTAQLCTVVRVWVLVWVFPVFISVDFARQPSGCFCCLLERLLSHIPLYGCVTSRHPVSPGCHSVLQLVPVIDNMTLEMSGWRLVKAHEPELLVLLVTTAPAVAITRHGVLWGEVCDSGHFEIFAFRTAHAFKGTQQALGTQG